MSCWSQNHQKKHTMRASSYQYMLPSTMTVHHSFKTYKYRPYSTVKRKCKENISRQDMLRVLHLSQSMACTQLKCSLSTLKRRFYELKEEFGLEKWPQYYHEIRHLPIFQRIYPMSLKFILNE